MSSGRSAPQDAAQNIAGNVEQFYTNEDVAVLHDIVLLAQELLPTLPTRERLPTNALFNAYYDILPRVGVNADHDSRYARILFKIGGLRGEGTLYEKFEEILSRMGIEIEFDQDEDGDDYSQLEDPQTNVEAAATGSLPQIENMSLRGRQRRNSESSAWNVASETHTFHKERRNSFSPPRNRLVSPETTGHQDIGPSTRFRPSQADQTSHGDQPDNLGAWVASMQEKPRRERGRSVSTHASLRIRRRSPSISHTHDELLKSPPYVGLDEAQSPNYSAVTSSTNAQHSLDSSPFFKGRAISYETENLMQTKASLVLQHYLSLAGSRILRLWRDKTIKARGHNANLNNLASQQDKNVLLNLAWDNWRSSLIEKRHLAETEQFFVHLERRSEQARGLYLLHRAFTHWGTSAFEAVERTSVARRHIIRTRTFNAWRDITAVNELKVRRQVIKRFFGTWKRQHNLRSSDNTGTVQVYESNLVLKVYKQWVRKLLDIKANSWRAANSKQRALFQWAIVARSAEERRRTADERRATILARNVSTIWRAEIHHRTQLDVQARSFRQLRVCSTALIKWRREAGVTPAKKALQTDVNVRLLRNTFSLWLQRARQERQAAMIDNLRIAREAWTNWRHKFRSQVLCARVNDRIILRSIYKWVLTERSMLAERFTKNKTLLNCLHSWTQRSKILRDNRWRQEDLAETAAVHRDRELVFRRWRSRLETHQQHEVNAVNFYTPRTLRGPISQWSERTNQLQQLEQWSRDAEFYFLASKTLRRWRVSTDAAKREKRKAAYVQVRRTTKMNLARGVLVDWRRQAHHIRELHARALDSNHNRTVVTGMNIFDRWHARVEELEELNSVWRGGVLRNQFTLWRARATAFRNLEVDAIINFQERQLDHAIKKWGLLTLQLGSHSRYAAEIREKNVKRSFRKTFMYWQQRTTQKMPVKASNQDALGAMGATPRAEIWSESGDDTEVELVGLDDPSTFTPVPGYLKTPSRRRERATAAVARFSSTTPRAPLPSPFDRQTRGWSLGGSLPLVRKGAARSQLGIGSEFADIAETSKDGINESN